MISLIINSYPKKFCFDNILVNFNQFNAYWSPCYHVSAFKHFKPDEESDRLNNNLTMCWKSKHNDLVTDWVWSFQNRGYVNNIQYKVATKEAIKLTLKRGYFSEDFWKIRSYFPEYSKISEKEVLAFSQSPCRWAS